MAETDPVQIVVEILNQTKDELQEIRNDLERLDLKNVDVDFEIDDDGEFARIQTKMAALQAQGLDFGIDMGRTGNDDGGLPLPDRPDWVGDFFDRRGGGGRSGLAELARQNAEEFRYLGRTLQKYRPSIMDWWNVLALLIPIMITLAGAAIGVAAALGAVATGAAAIVGIGLLGWGDDMQSTLQNLQRDFKRLGQELFQVFNPLGEVFQPIVERWMGGLANQLRELLGPLSRMTVFVDGLEAAGSGLIDWIAAVLTAMANMSTMAEQVSLRMGEALGQFLIDALSNMLREVHKNQDAYIEMAELLLNAIVIIFNLAKAVTMVIAQFQPLFAIIAALTDILSNKWLVAFLTAITTVLALEGALTGAIIAHQMFAQASLISALANSKLVSGLQASIAWLQTFIASANTATAAALRLAAVTGAGLLVAGAGLMAVRSMDSMTPPEPTHGRTRQVGGQTVINVQGDVRKREVDRIVDEMGPQSRKETNIRNSMNNG